MTGLSTSSNSANDEPDANRPRHERPLSNVSLQPAILLDASQSTPIPVSRHANLAPPSPSQMQVSPIDRAHSPSRRHGYFTDSSANALRISTDVLSTSPGVSSFPSYRDVMAPNNRNLSPKRNPLNRTTSANSLQLARTPSLKAALTGAFTSSNGSSSSISSPVINAMGDVTPLPSPLMSSDSPGPWKRLNLDAASPPPYRGKVDLICQPVSPTSTSFNPQPPSTSPKRKPYIIEPQDSTLASAQPATSATRKLHHTRNRSVSEYVPDPISIQKRPVVVSGTHSRRDGTEHADAGLRRESHLAESRGLTPTVTKPPTPPPSASSKDSMDSPVKTEDPSFEYFKARSRSDHKNRRWRSLGFLGRGTFSRVMLATSQIVPDGDGPEMLTGTPAGCRLDRKTLVAVKVCEHGPMGGASEDRVEMSLKRELEIMQAIHHPSLLDLKAWSIEPTRAILVMSFCPGGDLFDVTTTHRKSLTSPLMGRIVAELVSALQYLHEQNIVHRDIKLENVLVNTPPTELAGTNINWSTYPHSIVALADFGLSRRFTPGEPLETRCGSDDYAAPEVILGQPYDGRATDAWSLGVLLYALLEARLPFDPHPAMSDAHRMRSRTSHRIARVEWRWLEYAGDDGDHDGDEAKFVRTGLLGAMHIVEGLLRRARNRWTLDQVAAEPWVADALCVSGGIRFREEEAGEEVL
ncbi:Calcium/calmodulin-dependent/calcium-dependent protein kinase [Cordyceps fumosorosea ARSEF 2679]|uniref:Calcium/calmodulin-dependent/calcium-dependent protein kinase n=1 Tax=Cordyceps fumosorosea (strain ARSEF 2679) TaxID=1081104 RepID=A0A167NE36_CORFA|nr:Calcium/calmodulin-dependent/calcium-dependent protein kinase [Cordyceps fumosorosea ARSEF 2679]OAA55456.1 Calcium/calmodulin-dependent/calcium-dependent protein kinase [Cordyceps fumosorosea ARSEF 2679]